MALIPEPTILIANMMFIAIGTEMFISGFSFIYQNKNTKNKLMNDIPENY